MSELNDNWWLTEPELVPEDADELDRQYWTARELYEDEYNGKSS